MTTPNRSHRRRRPDELLLGLALTMGITMTQAAEPPDLAALRAQVWQTECRFAASMAQRDLAAFEHHLSAQALFFSGEQVLRGPAAVLAGWRAYFEGAEAPFAWAPDQVEVLADGSLAHSSGLVRNPKGEPVARFNSVWRQEAPGVWRIVFDKGSPLRKNEPVTAPDCKP